ncbi:hypothetical protein RCG67_01120 [Kocuria sp. CPCC 205292]|uniref:hypothetical protein n=1 Tax=Kocuria cellulosilytica TaxID=3071451 RepID=UPI0034D6283E
MNHVNNVPLLGVIDPLNEELGELKLAGVNAAVLPVRWSQLETGPNQIDLAYLSEVINRHEAMLASGIKVIIDPGFQYVPDHIFDIPDSRFVNQDGEIWRAGPGENIVDPVFNPAVRAAYATHLNRLGRIFEDREIYAVRVGGLIRGELGYPVGKTPGRYWMYSEAAKASMPVPNWRPGTGSTVEARFMLDHYLDSLTKYSEWLVNGISDAFPQAYQYQVLLPSWGVRPGALEEQINQLGQPTISESGRRGIEAGLDWARTIPALANNPKVAFSSTWADAASQGSGAQYQAPMLYIASLSRPYGSALLGENTGKGTPAELRATTSALQGVNAETLIWMRASNLGLPGQVSATDLGVAFGEMNRESTGTSPP